MAQENMGNEMGLRPVRLDNGLRDSDGDWWGWLRFGTIVCKSLVEGSLNRRKSGVEASA